MLIKERYKNNKNKDLLIKTKKSLRKHKVAFFILNPPHSPIINTTCSELWNYGENIVGKKLSVEHTPKEHGINFHLPNMSLVRVNAWSSMEILCSH